MSKWNINNLPDEALKYKTRNEFRVKARGAYKAAKLLGIFDTIIRHMPLDAKRGNPSHNYKWTPENIIQKTIECKTLGEFASKYPSAYNSSKRLGILKEISKNFVSGLSGNLNPNYRWTDEMLFLEASKYVTVGEFQKKSKGAYLACIRRGILEKVSENLKKSTKESKAEINLFCEVKKIYPKAHKLSDRKASILGRPHIRGFDIDIYIPELRKGIEFDGKYFHSFEGLKRSRPNWPEQDVSDYHKIKDEYFLSKGIQIFHVREEDWLKNREDCIKNVFNFLGRV